VTSDLSGKMLLIEEARQVIRLLNLNMELSEMLHSHLDYVLRFCEANGIRPLSIEKTTALMEKERALVGQIMGTSPAMQHDDDITRRRNNTFFLHLLYAMRRFFGRVVDLRAASRLVREELRLDDRGRQHQEDPDREVQEGPRLPSVLLGELVAYREPEGIEAQ